VQGQFLQAQAGGLVRISLTGKAPPLPLLLDGGQLSLLGLLSGRQVWGFGLGQLGGLHDQKAQEQLLHRASGSLPAIGAHDRGPMIALERPFAAARVLPQQWQRAELCSVDQFLSQGHGLRDQRDKPKSVRCGQGHGLPGEELAVSNQERLIQLGQVLAELRDMEAMLGAVTAVAIGQMAPHRHPVGRHGEPKEQLFEVWPVIATVTKRHERPLLVIPLIRPIDLQTRGIGMQTRQVQGIALDRLADHGAVKAVQTRPPQGIQGPAQAVVMEMRRVQRVLKDHLQVIAGQCPCHAG
jgi:hypothetical protein